MELVERFSEDLLHMHSATISTAMLHSFNVPN